MLYNYQRRSSTPVHIGGLTLGGEAPIRLQSMTNTPTDNVEASVAQIERIVRAGADLVRLTAQGSKEVRALETIEQEVRQRGLTVPLVADIHFNAALADAAAGVVEKVRINPGNYVDAARTFRHIDYTDEEYRQELERLRARFIPFLQRCRAHGTAIRIGVNHGSLSDRIMSRYGDTPAGIVESCMEFLRICRQERFDDVVISIKASNTAVMVTSVRLLVQQMELEGMSYPLHLGVTEAGDGEDGRIKSAVGIGALLADGIGDTVRVSLSEAPEAEVPVARQLVDYVTARAGHARIEGPARVDYNPTKPERRVSNRVGAVGDGQVPVVVGSVVAGADCSAEGMRCLQARDVYGHEALLAELKAQPNQVLLIEADPANPVGSARAAIFALTEAGCLNPVVLSMTYPDASLEAVQLKAAADFGVMLLDQLVDGIRIVAPALADEAVVNTALAILQAARQRFSKTEYIACPSCGRTLFDLTTTLAQIKAATSHLKGLKIGVMGCIVNGPGEMADADYGYVGAGPGRVSLYKGKTCIERNIPADRAVARLLEFIEEDRKTVAQ
jgi:(E)-4-hydroxy-3-methylbut-2-enyl-diphosphate synthase